MKKIQNTSSANSHNNNVNKSGNFFSAESQHAEPFFNKRLRIQPKLTIGQPNDKYEQEADAMANQVVQQLEEPGINTKIQRSCSACGAPVNGSEEDIQTKAIFESNEDTPIQQKCEACASRENKIQTKSAGEESEASADLESRLNHSKGSGMPITEGTRTSMESVFGSDFGGVRVHTGSDAVQMNQELGAKAFTNGSDIYFNQGNYNPGSKDGQNLLAHELTHVVQQEGNKI